VQEFFNPSTLDEPYLGENLAQRKDLGKLVVAFTKIFRILPNFLGRIPDKKLMSGYRDNEFNSWRQ